VAAVNSAVNSAFGRRVGSRPKIAARLAIASSLIVLFATFAVGQNARSTESQVKAAYLYNFGKFVTWTDRAGNSDTFQICVLGKDPFGRVLDSTVKGESIDQKTVRVARISRVQEAAPCNILFISASEQGHLSAILADAQRMEVLTVSDMPHFAERGGTIGLVNHQDRIRFEVNRNMAEKSHLVLSSELLKVAVRVIQGKPGR